MRSNYKHFDLIFSHARSFCDFDLYLSSALLMVPSWQLHCTATSILERSSKKQICAAASRRTNQVNRKQDEIGQGVSRYVSSFIHTQVASLVESLNRVALTTCARSKVRDVALGIPRSLPDEMNRFLRWSGFVLPRFYPA